MSGQIESIVNGNGDAVVKLYKISQIFSTRIASISNSWLNDLQYYVPDVWQEVEDFRKKMMLKNLSMLVEQGKSEKLVIDLPSTIIMGVLISAVQGVVNPEFILHNNVSLTQAGEMTLEIIFSGILTKKGRKLFKQYKSSS